LPSALIFSSASVVTRSPAVVRLQIWGGGRRAVKRRGDADVIRRQAACRLASLSHGLLGMPSKCSLTELRWGRGGPSQPP